MNLLQTLQAENREIMSANMIAFEEMSDEKDKAADRPKAIHANLDQLTEHTLNTILDHIESELIPEREVTKVTERNSILQVKQKCRDIAANSYRQSVLEILDKLRK